MGAESRPSFGRSRPKKTDLNGVRQGQEGRHFVLNRVEK